MKAAKEKESLKDYQIETSKLDVDESEFTPIRKHQDRVSFTQKETAHRDDINKEPEVMK